MNIILNTLHERILTSEIPLQTNNPMIRDNHSPQELIPNNLIANPSVRSFEHSSLADPHQTLEEHLNNFSLQTRADEYSVIFEDAFDQLSIIYHSLSTKPQSIEISSLRINEDEKFCSEIRYFSHLLILLFRALLLQSPDITINKTQDKEFIDLQHRLEQSEDRISSLRKHFHHEKSNSLKAQLKDRFMEEKSRGKIALRYANDWKQNHLLQWIEMLFQFEQNSIQTLRKYDRILHQSSLVHEQTIQILIEQGNALKSDADHWYEYYQNETSRFERELTDFRYELKQLRNHREDLGDEYERMKMIVDEYHRMKIEENLLLEKRKLEEQAIERIQTWWRGTIIRRVKRMTSLKSK